MLLLIVFYRFKIPIRKQYKRVLIRVAIFKWFRFCEQALCSEKCFCGFFLTFSLTKSQTLCYILFCKNTAKSKHKNNAKRQHFFNCKSNILSVKIKKPKPKWPHRPTVKRFHSIVFKLIVLFVFWFLVVVFLLFFFVKLVSRVFSVLCDLCALCVWCIPCDLCGMSVWCILSGFLC